MAIGLSLEGLAGCLSHLRGLSTFAMVVVRQVAGKSSSLNKVGYEAQLELRYVLEQAKHHEALADG
jgi:hypothetical protein